MNVSGTRTFQEQALAHAVDEIRSAAEMDAGLWQQGCVVSGCDEWLEPALQQARGISRNFFCFCRTGVVMELGMLAFELLQLIDVIELRGGAAAVIQMDTSCVLLPQRIARNAVEGREPRAGASQQKRMGVTLQIAVVPVTGGAAQMQQHAGLCLGE